MREPAIEAFSRFGEGLGEWFTVLAFVAVALYGIAFLRRAQFGAHGWLFKGGGALGLILHLAGVGIPAFIFLATGALGVVAVLDGRPPDSIKGGTS
jgi:uncharacterized YccA/Bax inhibitor family protein